MNKTVLITGGSGLIGKPLIDSLINKGYQIHLLSRNPKPANQENVKSFYWDINKHEIDPSCLDNVTSIIHLAGEGIASKPWTNKQKVELIKSRTESIELIYKLIKNNNLTQVKEVISASGVGYYGNRGNEFLNEDSSPGDDFLSQCCIEWEKAVDAVPFPEIRIVKLRTGVVLAKNGGALAQIDKPIKFGVGAALGSGNQYMPWIHLNDIVSLYCFALENDIMQGVYNAATKQVVTNAEFTQILANTLHKKLWLPPVPEFVLRIIMGEMKAIVINSTRTISDKVTSTGFNFEFDDLNAALKELYAQKGS